MECINCNITFDLAFPLRNARARGWGRGGGGGGGGEILTWASGYNFPLFLVYPVDMPGTISQCLHARIVNYYPP